MWYVLTIKESEKKIVESMNNCIGSCIEMYIEQIPSSS